jgi:hypothetical protein
VVWNCGWDAFIIKGDHNRVYNNTCLSNGQSDILAFATPEPRKPWRKQWPLLKAQNRNSEIANNCAAAIRGSRGRKPRPPTATMASNYTGPAPMLADPEHLDFRPRTGSPLIDAGKSIPGITDAHAGNAPDIGACEHGAPRWVPGCRNGIWLAAEPRAQATLALRVALTMPVPEPVELKLEASGARVRSGAALRFAPSDWMRPRDVALELPRGAAQPVALDGSADGLGTLHVPDVRRIGAAGQQHWFDQGTLVGMKKAVLRYEGRGR